MTDRESVGRQYASPGRLHTRVAIWGPGPEGVSPRDLLRDAPVDATALPYADSTYDLVVAAWMLNHVPDLHATLREVARVLGPVGTFLAVTNGDRHLETLLRDAGGAPLVTQFSSESGEQVLRGLSRPVERRVVETRAYFPDHAAAVAMLASFDDSLGAGLPWFEGSRDDVGHTTLFVARPAV